MREKATAAGNERKFCIEQMPVQTHRVPIVLNHLVVSPVIFDKIKCKRNNQL
jgi:hypothetical protein